jgi:hypothetical protein
MIASIERLRRYVRRGSALAAAPMLLLVMGPGHHDPIHRHGPGKGGVLPIPATPAPDAAHLDSLLNGRSPARLERGRVLYAPGHAPHDTAVIRAPRKRTCPSTAQRVVAQNGTTARPIS